MIILGIDPGSRVTGYGVIEVSERKERLIDFGIFRFQPSDDPHLRLKEIYDSLISVIDRFVPDECALEMPVYGRNPQSMLKLGRAQAAAMLAALNRQIPVTQYTPKEVKKAVTGNGSASKQQVLYMVRSILGVRASEGRMTLDAADALAVGLCHAHRDRADKTGRYRDWARFIRDNPDRVSFGE